MEIVLKRKWIRDKATIVRRILDSPMNHYQYWDTILAARDRYPHLSIHSLRAIEKEIGRMDINEGRNLPPLPKKRVKGYERVKNMVTICFLVYMLCVVYVAVMGNEDGYCDPKAEKGWIRLSTCELGMPIYNLKERLK